MKNFRLIILLVVLIISIIGCGKSDARWVNSVVFLSNRESPKGEFDIFISSVNDSAQTNLTEDLQFIRSISRPSLSPDKRYLLYLSINKNEKYLNLIDLLTKEHKKLAKVNVDLPYTSFIKGGREILFVKKVNGKKQIFTKKLNGIVENNISSSLKDEYNPKLSNDESKLVFLRKSNKKISIVIRDMESKDEHEIKVNGNQINPMFWGKNDLVYESFVDGSYKIFIYKIKSMKTEQITTGDSNANNPHILSDNRSLIFISDGRGKRYKDICLLDLETKEYNLLTKDLNMINYNMSVASNNDGIIFESSRFNDSEIYFLNLKDNSFINISNSKAWDCQPSF